MKKLTSIIAIAFLMTLGFNAVAQTGNTESTTANASATIITPIDINWARDLEFGTIAHPGKAATVVITPTDALGITYSENDMVTTLSTRSSAKFGISGEKAATFALVVPSTITLSGANSTSMVITTSKNLAATGNVLDGSGNQTLYIGGSLAIGAEQAIGQYNAEFTVTVTYE